MEKEFTDKFNNKVILTDKRWKHIINEHPEVESYKKRIFEVLKGPDLVKRSKRDSE